MQVTGYRGQVTEKRLFRASRSDDAPLQHSSILLLFVDPSSVRRSFFFTL
jgi:hypothetical protein